MKITAVFVASANGKVTQGDEPNIYSWTSKEDGAHFFSLLESFNLIIMGSKTYEAAKDKIKLSKDKLRIVLTRNPDSYKNEEILGMLEFRNVPPHVLIKQMEKQGYTKALFVGGADLFVTLLKNNCIDELYLTLEPYLFGTGKNLIEEKSGVTTSLKLEEVKQLNEKGTLLLKYQVLQD